MNDNYEFNPLNHWFEPIRKYPEIGFNYPMIDGYDWNSMKLNNEEDASK